MNLRWLGLLIFAIGGVNSGGGYQDGWGEMQDCYPSTITEVWTVTEFCTTTVTTTCYPPPIKITKYISVTQYQTCTETVTRTISCCTATVTLISTSVETSTTLSESTTSTTTTTTTTTT